MKLITVFPTLSSPIINILYNGFSNIIFIKPDTKIIEEQFYKRVLMRYLDYKRKMNSDIMEIKEKNAKNIVGYKPDHLTDEIEEISNMLLPFEEIQTYLQTKTNFDVMEALELWANHTIEIIESHNEAYLND